MKNSVLSILFIVFPILLFSQIPGLEITGTVNKNFKTESGISLEKGNKLTLNVYEYYPYLRINIVDDNSNLTPIAVTQGDFENITLDPPSTSSQLWQTIRINSDFYSNLSSRGMQYDLRSSLEDETIDLLANMETYYGFFNDEYVVDYLQGVLFKINPATFGDGRPGNLVVKILKASEPNAFSCPTGTIILTSGLLSTIRSEEELIGILAHEIAHFELDHQIINVNKEIERQKRAEFWSTLATAMAAASEIYLAAQEGIYLGGSLTNATAVLSSGIANSITQRIGTNYSQEQEIEADNAAMQILEFLNKDPKAFSAALIRIEKYCVLNGDYIALSSSGSHPELPTRINRIGRVDPDKFNSTQYDQIISFINTSNAICEYNLNHFETAIMLCDRNIETGVAMEDDYLIKGMALRSLYDTPEKNQEALSLINQAKSLNIIPNNYLYKQEGITLLRLNQKQEAINAFQTYLQYLEQEVDKSSFILDEIEWTKKMIFKSKFL